MAHTIKVLIAVALTAALSTSVSAQDAQYPMAKTYSSVEKALAASRAPVTNYQRQAVVYGQDGATISNIEIYETPLLATDTNMVHASTRIVESPTQSYSMSYSSAPEYGYSVAAGDTLYSIARANGLKASQLMNANGLTSSAISVGQQLTIPGQQARNTQAEAIEAHTSHQAPQIVRTVQPVPTGTNVYRVLPGDTLYSIARMTCSSVDGIAFASNIDRDGILSAGQSLTLPAGNCAN